MARTILIVEDEEITREGYARALKAQDWGVEAVGNVEAALSALRSGKSFDIMLLDRRLVAEGRVEDGSTLLRIANEQGLPLPLVVISAYLDASCVQTFLALGVRVLLSKPVRIEIISEILKALCDGIDAAPLKLRGIDDGVLEAQLIESNEGRMVVYGGRNDAFDIPPNARLRTLGVERTNIEVFLSYSHLDEKLRIDLDKHLSTLKRNDAIKVWHDRKMPRPGIPRGDCTSSRKCKPRSLAD